MIKTLIWAYLVASVVLASQNNCSTDFVFSVDRKTTDHYQPNTSTNCVCNEGNNTYLVTEQQCVNNSTFFSGKLSIATSNENIISIIYILTECPFAITPAGEPLQLRLSVHIIMGNSRMQTSNSTGMATNATVINTNSTEKLVNSSICSISSLEVYRGREQAIEISHDGFILDNSGSIEVISLASSSSQGPMHAFSAIQRAIL